MTTFKSFEVAGALGLLAACSSTPVTPPASTATVSATAPAATPVKPPPVPVAVPRPAPSSAISSTARPSYLDPKSSLYTSRSVYFDFDDAGLKSEYTALMEQHGKYLASHPALAIKVEGNTDERGSAEYNLALGQKRAQAVVKALEVFGVKPAQLEAVSWGMEKPKATGHVESAWAQNRRADSRYPLK